MGSGSWDWRCCFLEGTLSAFGIVLLLCFSIGHAVLSVIAGTSVGLVRKLTESPRYARADKIIKIVLGTVIFLTALWLLWEAFSEGILGHEHEAMMLGKGAKWLL